MPFRADNLDSGAYDVKAITITGDPREDGDETDLRKSIVSGNPWTTLPIVIPQDGVPFSRIAVVIQLGYTRHCAVSVIIPSAFCFLVHPTVRHLGGNDFMADFPSLYNFAEKLRTHRGFAKHHDGHRIQFADFQYIPKQGRSGLLTCTSTFTVVTAHQQRCMHCRHRTELSDVCALHLTLRNLWQLVELLLLYQFML